MFIKDPFTPALVLGSVHHGGLAVTRTLGRLGFDVYNLDKSRWAPAFRSKYSCGSYVWDIAQSTPTQTVRFLLKIGEEIGRPTVLIPITDEFALFIVEHIGDLRAWFLFPQQDPAMVRMLHDKRQMQNIATDINIPTANTFYPRNLNELDKFILETSFPIVFKASNGVRLERDGIPTKKICEKPDELKEILERTTEDHLPYIMLQEYIPGGPESVWMFDGYFDSNSECLFGLTGQKLRQYPAYTGPTSFGVCAENEWVRSTTCRLVKSIGYQGPIDIGYRYDSRESCFKLLDVNPRVGTTFRLFTDDTGMDVVRAMYLYLSDRQINPGKPRPTRKWLVEDLDMLSSIRYLMDGNLALHNWFRSFRGLEETAVFASDDWAGVLGVFKYDFFRLMSRISKDKIGKKALSRHLADLAESQTE